MKNETNTVETVTSERQTMLGALRTFVRQRPRLDFRNYWSGDHWNARTDALANYRADLRPIMQAKRDAERMIAYIERTGVNAWELVRASQSAFSGRLEWNKARTEWDYCTGQYWPTEYRKAACCVLARALADYWRADGGTWERVHKNAKNELGRGIANRWFIHV